MQLQPIIDSSRVFIGRDAQNEWLYVDWRGEFDPEAAQAACGLVLESLRAWPCHKILSDNTSITRIWLPRTATAWGPQWLAAMQAAGLQYLAWVLPQDLLARQIAEAKIDGINTLRVGTFDDLASACHWLQQQKCG